jgi:hypothetical protein
MVIFETTYVVKYKACIHNNIWTVDCNINGSATPTCPNFVSFRGCLTKGLDAFIYWKYCILWKVQLFASMPGQRLFKPINFFKLYIFVTGQKFTDLYTIHAVSWTKTKLFSERTHSTQRMLHWILAFLKKCFSFILF